MSRTTYNLKDALMGGPGLRGYAYRAEIYCIEHGRRLTQAVWPEVADARGEVDSLDFSDSERIPQPAFFPESECAQHCAECGELLYRGE